jgi:hypothetical protein
MSESVDFRCPFCGKHVHATTVNGGEILHPLPTCVEFEQLEPDVFLKKVREHFEKTQVRA